ncbi:FAD-dependent monooxygenase [Williamsia sp. M5A3_1d]
MAERVLDCEVAIVGFGPGGQVLASLLGLTGHRVVVFEKFARPYGLPRMSTLDGEIARVLQHTGDPEIALHESIPQREVEMHGVDGSIVGRLDWSRDHSGHPSHLSLHQPNIETAMARRIDEFDHVSVLWGHSVIDIVDDGGWVVSAVDDDGQSTMVWPRYLVGMDGASSMVRQALGIELEVLRQHDDRWVLTDYDVVASLPDGLDHRIYMSMGLETPYFYGPNGAGRCRIDVRLSSDDSDAAVADDSEAGFTFLEQTVGIPRDRVRQTRRVVYRFRSQLATALSVGDAFIGGDAAHAMPPHMGQGACTAMRDSANLAWKLDLVLRGISDPSLLDTYESERLPHDSQFVWGSLGSWTMATQTDPVGAAQRDDYFRTTDDELDVYIEPLRNGVLHRTSPDEYATQAGELAPQGRVRYDGREALLDDIVGYGFQLISNREIDRELGAQRLAGLERLGVHRVVVGGETSQYADVNGTYADYFAEHGAVAFVGRPDGYTFGATPDVPTTLAMVDDLLTQLLAPITASP